MKKNFRQFGAFFKYCLVGTMNTALDAGLVFLLVEYVKIPLALATTIAFTVAASNGFFLNKIWTFQNHSENHRKLFIKFLIVALIGMLLTHISMYLQVEILGVWYLHAKLISSGLVLVWNFLGNKYWTFTIEKRAVKLLDDFRFEFSIIIPAYNEENRIKSTLLSIGDYLSTRGLDAEIIIVDDGSTDRTVEIIRALRSAHPLRILLLGKNYGKGYAIRKGIEAAQGRYLLFTDADNSTPIEELEKLADAMRRADIAIGSRYLATSAIRIKQPLARVWIGRIGNFLIRLFLLSGVRDTQCGFKLFKHNVAKDVFARQKVFRWGFDMEALAVAKALGYTITEIPVSWFNSAESRLRPFHDAARTFGELVYIKLNLWSGRYR